MNFSFGTLALPSQVTRPLGLSGDSLETMAYSARGALRAIGGSYGTILSDLAYSASGQALFARYGDAAATTVERTYDNRNRLVQSIASRSAAPAIWTAPPSAAYSIPSADTTQLTLDHLELTYDDVGNPKTIHDASADYWPQGSKPVSRAFQYDAAYRMRQVDYAHQLDTAVPPFLSEANAGDRRPVAQVPGQQRIQSQWFEHDWQGNLTYSGDNESLPFDRSAGAIHYGGGKSGQAQGGPNQLVDADYTHARYDVAGNMIELTVGRPSCWARMPNCSHRFVYDWDEVGADGPRAPLGLRRGRGARVRPGRRRDLGPRVRVQRGRSRLDVDVGGGR